MPLAIYRRHSTDCQFFGRPRRDSRSQKCECTIWVQGSLGREYLRRTLDLTSWQAAQDLVRGWEASGEVGVLRVEIPDIANSVERFFEDMAARGLADVTIGKHNVLLRKCFLPWCRTRGLHSLKQIGVDEITQFRTTWTDAPITKHKKQERLKGFFHFCVAREWLRTNPVAALKPVKVPPTPTLPFEEDQVAAILEACDRFSLKGIYGEQNRARLKALTLLMRYSGLRIRDAVTCERKRLVNGKLLLYQAKTGTPVYCPLPPLVVDALNEVNGSNPQYFFWSGNGKPKSVVADVQRSFRKLLELADVQGHPHMFRDTFAVELFKRGVPIETVSMLLGHASVKVTEKHYKPWVKTLQEKLEADAMKAWPSTPVPARSTSRTKRRSSHGRGRASSSRARKTTRTMTA
jgi:integrase/recombinase XerD